MSGLLFPIIPNKSQTDSQDAVLFLFYSLLLSALQVPLVRKGLFAPKEIQVSLEFRWLDATDKHGTILSELELELEPKEGIVWQQTDIPGKIKRKRFSRGRG